MRKRAILYLEILPFQLRSISILNMVSQIPNSMLTKMGDKGRRDEKTISLPKRRHPKH